MEETAKLSGNSSHEAVDRRPAQDTRHRRWEAHGAGVSILFSCPVSEHVGRGTNTGPLAGPAGELPPTGRAFELRIAEVYQLRGGQLSRLRAYYDMATFMRQLGLLPPPGHAGG